MLFSAYNSNGVRVLSAAYAEAGRFARASLTRKLSAGEEAALDKRLARNLMDAHDFGERDPVALKDAALQGIFALVAGN